MPVRASVIVTTAAFLENVRALRKFYPELDRAINDFCLDALLDYDFPQVVFEATGVETKYALLEHELGEQVRPLAVLFDATPAKPSPSEPYRTITLRRVVEARALPGTPSAAA